MRILELTDLYRPVVGGLERFVEILSGEMSARGHEVIVATGATASAPAGVERNGAVSIHRLTGWQHTLLKGSYASAERPFHPTIPDPGMMRALRDLIGQIRPDVVHAHSWNVMSVLPVARRLRLPVVIQAHDYGLICHRKTMIRQDGSACSGPDQRICTPCGAPQYGLPRSAALAVALRASRPMLRQARVTAVSQHVADRLTPVLFSTTGQPVEVLPSFVEDGLPQVAATAPAPAGLPDGDFILFVGALTSVKGLDVLLAAHRSMASPVPLVLLGTPQVDTPAAATLGSGVTLLETVPHDQVLAAMARASVVVAPSIWADPLPMTVTEAQLAGTPVVASRIGGIPDQVADGVTGLLVAPGDAGELTAALDDLMADPGRRRAMGAAGQVHAQRLTAVHGTPRILEVLADEVARSAHREPARADSDPGA
jgi:glycosyltransferase involved in cell wall biosynthesis